MATSDNGRFVKLWHEVEFIKIGLNLKTREEALKSKKKICENIYIFKIII